MKSILKRAAGENAAVEGAAVDGAAVDGTGFNLRGGKALIRKSLFSFVASRGFFWTLAVSWMMPPLILLFVWTAAAGNGTVGGLGKQVFISYYLCLIIVNQLTYPASHWVIGDNIRMGTLSTWLLRPLPIIYEAAASDIALKIVCMPLVIVLTAGLALFLGYGAGLGPAGIALFIPTLLMSCILRFIAAYTLSLSAMWTQKTDSLLSINDLLVFLLAGQAAPAILLPGILGTLSEYLPFRYMLGFPVEILTGMLSGQQVVKGLLVQAVWLSGAILAQRTVYRRGIRRFNAIGG